VMEGRPGYPNHVYDIANGLLWSRPTSTSQACASGASHPAGVSGPLGEQGAIASITLSCEGREGVEDDCEQEKSKNENEENETEQNPGCSDGASSGGLKEDKRHEGQSNSAR
jgi:hypothetical protein